MTIQALDATVMQAARPNAGTTIRKMEGLMWYAMLSEMNGCGFESSSLGVGSDAYQSLFLWNIAETDFGNYDGALASATLRQIGGRASPPPALSPSLFSAGVTGPTASGTAATAGSAPDGDAGGLVGDAVLLAHATDLTRSIWPAIRAAATTLGVPPVGLLAQAALETGWGSAVPGNNLFGIKAQSGEDSTLRPTHEMSNGALVPETAAFRDYTSPLACVADYVRLIQSNFQSVIGQESVESFADALQAGGFATDGNYASKIIMISQSPMMPQMLQAVGGAPSPAD
jgi:peptidoglycan hydrolase FlgJ